MHPCAFLSRRLSSAERNYDVGNRELLAVKVTLEEWRHWLEGSLHPFIVWTDHKNLEYIRQAKKLNSRQPRWALFFNHFCFTLSYRPGSRNVKQDALSRIYDPEPVAKEPEPILLLNRVVGAVFVPGHAWDYCNLDPFPPDRGQTFQWTSSRGSKDQKRSLNDRIV